MSKREENQSMHNTISGFTLIELLVVLIVLAIISLITIPIVVKLLDDTEKNSEIRSAELYVDHIDNAIMAYNGSNTLIDATCTVKSDGNLDCGSVQLEVEVKKTKATEGIITIENRKVSKVENLKVGDNYYLTDSNGKVVAEPKPQYYIWDIKGIINTLSVPTNPSTDPPTGKNFYIGFNVENGKISSSYVCFKKNNKQYCLKGGDDGESFAINKQIILNAFDDIIQTDLCSLDGKYNCQDYTGLGVNAYSDGYVNAYNADSECYVDSDGYLQCNYFPTRYYSWTTSTVKVGDPLPPDVKLKASELTTNPGFNFYLRFDSEDEETISAMYACLLTDKEYCLKGNDKAKRIYKKNQDMIREVFPDCTSCGDSSCLCSVRGKKMSAYSNGIVAVRDTRLGYQGSCSIYGGFASCIETSTSSPLH